MNGYAGGAFNKRRKSCHPEVRSGTMRRNSRFGCVRGSESELLTGAMRRSNARHPPAAGYAT